VKVICRYSFGFLWVHCVFLTKVEVQYSTKFQGSTWHNAAVTLISLVTIPTILPGLLLQFESTEVPNGIQPIHSFTNISWLIMSAILILGRTDTSSSLVCGSEEVMFLSSRNRLEYTYIKKTLSYPCNRPRRPIGLWDVEASTFSRQSNHRWR
jgi:hypothetical protein